LVVMMDPDSTYEKHIETFLMVQKQRRYSRTHNLLAKCLNHNILGLTL
jgi:hypothetical protein